MRNLTLNQLVHFAHKTATEHGFWDDVEPGKANDKDIVERLALVGCEVAEAVESLRTDPTCRTEDENGGVVQLLAAGQLPDKTSGKPEGLAFELADVCIRVFDLCGELNIDLDGAVALKMRHNETRPVRHGKRF